MTTDRLLIVQRDLAAPPARVFEAFTTPAQLARWIGPRGVTATNVAVDLRVGGGFSFDLDFGETTVTMAGRYEAIEPPVRLVHTWGVAGDEDDSRVTLELASHEGGTRLRLIHAGLEPEEFGQNRAGWDEFFDQLEEYLSDRMEGTTDE